MSDAGDDLAMRRKELEREFEDKLRDLKQQDQRRRHALEQDRLDWENARREKEKVLADRNEKARRQDENIKRDLEELKLARRGLEAARALGQEHAAVKAEAKAAQAAEGDLKARLQATGNLLGGLVVFATLGAATLLVSALLWTPRTTALLAAVVLAGTLLVQWRRQRLARGP